MDKKDLEEIEKWKKQKMNYVETYGVDIFHEKKKKKSVKIFEKLFNLLYRIFKAILIILIFVIIIVTLTGIIMYYSYIDSKLHVDPVETISNMYSINVEIISKNIDEDRNGNYVLTTKENQNIQFNAHVNWNSLTQDYADRCHKYFYEKWENENKEKLNIIENIAENNILSYEQYIKIENNEQLENAVNLIYDLREFAGEDFSPDWNIYIIAENQRMYLFNSANYSREETLKRMQEMYDRVMNGEIVEPRPNPIGEFFGGM